MKSTNWICYNSISHETVEDAWEEYIKNFIDFCTWVKGYKYWRVRPSISENTDFGISSKQYYIRSRIIIADEELKGLEPANFIYDDKEYKSSDYANLV